MNSSQLPEQRPEPIAIVGMACRYPDADNPDQLWRSVIDGRRSFRRLPRERVDLDDYFDADRDAQDRTYSARAAVLEGWEFDHSAFGVPETEYRAGDPAHWLALETAGRALADAGFAGAVNLERDRVGVVMGNSLTGDAARSGMLRLRWPYVRKALSAAIAETGLAEPDAARLLERAEHHYLSPFPPTGADSLTAGLPSTIAGRICDHFDLHGGGYIVDSESSSSLLAVITACRSLRDGDADLMLAGGVDVSLDPHQLVGFAKVGALAEDRMRIYDERATGFFPGEGCGVLVLMRAEDAYRQGLRVYAEIVGWGMSSDGKGRPDWQGQLLAMRRAYQLAGQDPGMVGYLEGDGTGTAAGDTAELTALTELRRGAQVPAVLGSIKANIGNTRAAAGVAGVIKTAMSINTGVLPPTTGCAEPHPILRVGAGELEVPPYAQPWPAGERLAGVSATGLGGTNTHLVLRAPQGVEEAQEPPHIQQFGTRRNPDTDLVVISGQTPDEVDLVLARLEADAHRLSEAELHDLACQFGHEAYPGPVRVALPARNVEQLAMRAAAARSVLAELQPGGFHAISGAFVGWEAAGRVGLLFPGQGAPLYPDAGALGRDLTSQPLPTGLSAEQAMGTAAAQPAIYRRSMAALDWLDRLGLHASAAIGHSLGELAALVWAGCLRRSDATQIVIKRGELMSRGSESGTGMVSVAADLEQATALCTAQMAVACYNGPRSHVLAGPIADVHLVARRATRIGMAAVVLPVSHAFHSPAVAGCVDTFKGYLGAFTFSPPSGRVVSTVYGRELTDQDPIDQVLCEQIVLPVRFGDAVARLRGDIDLWVEAGPGHTLSTLITDQHGAPVVSLDSGNASDTGLAEVAGAIFAVGALSDLTAFYTDRPYRPTNILGSRTFLTNPCESPVQVLPEPEPEPVPEPEPMLPLAEPAPEARSPEWTDLVRTVTKARHAEPEPVRPEKTRFVDRVLLFQPGAELIAEATISLDTDPHLAGQRIDGAVLLPPALAMEALAQAASSVAGRRMTELSEVRFGAPITIPEGGSRTVRLYALRSSTSDGELIEALLRTDDSDFQVDAAQAVFPGTPCTDPVPKLRILGGGEVIDGDRLYEQVLPQRGRFRLITQLAAATGRHLQFELDATDDEPWFDGPPVLGAPGILDATLHALNVGTPHRRLLPSAVDRLVVARAEGPTRKVYAAQRPGDDQVWDVVAVDESGLPVIAWTGVHLRDVGPLRRSGPWPTPLLPAYVERGAIALGLPDDLRVRITQQADGSVPMQRGRSHLSQLTLTVQAGRDTACEWHTVAERTVGQWLNLLGAEAEPILIDFLGKSHEPSASVATRLWAVQGCMAKAGIEGQILADGIYEDGWVLFRAGNALIASTVVELAEEAEPVAIAILADASLVRT
ncbi:acyltransferase domain-containing protein [Pseudonocardiaceae bacterium YIM PH 21723]|nr:acyltransferase domain-containing protein [Pseudonocardiaceae bacterium YIM PH 21723]